MYKYVYKKYVYMYYFTNTQKVAEAMREILIRLSSLVIFASPLFFLYEQLG